MSIYKDINRCLILNRLFRRKKIIRYGGLNVRKYELVINFRCMWVGVEFVFSLMNKIYMVIIMKKLIIDLIYNCDFIIRKDKGRR